MFDAWAPCPPDPSAMDFAERLAMWVGPLDAIGLQAAHRSIHTAASTDLAMPNPSGAARAAVVAGELRRVRQTLAQAIAGALALCAESADYANYSRYRHQHGALQRQMAGMIGALRAEVRQAMASLSPRLRRLALLDAAIEQVITPREQTVLPLAVALLGKRFEQLSAAQAPAWLDTFSRDWQAALLAERDVRLAPVAGLVDAINNEMNDPA